jgi:zinc protease
MPNFFRHLKALTFAVCAIGATTACTATQSGKLPPVGSEISIPFERYTLTNGLSVILHIDRTEPVVAVHTIYNVGSANDPTGLTGFAHLFEHLLSRDSENLGPLGYTDLASRVGAISRNASTGRDDTNYHWVIPSDALEKVLWAESERMGYFINTVTQNLLGREQQVVINEWRQGANRPFGREREVSLSTFYPDGHPYSWPVIGRAEDLEAATLNDLKIFYSNWYGPNNAVLVLAGDFDVSEAKDWVETYFGEIPARATPSISNIPPVGISAERKVVYEDKLARAPRLQLLWEGVPYSHPDRHALQYLVTILAGGKGTPLFNELIENSAIASQLSMTHSGFKLGSELVLHLDVQRDISLGDALDAVQRALRQFDAMGIGSEEFELARAAAERDLYLGLNNINGRAFRLGEYEVYTGGAEFMREDVRRVFSVTPNDVMRVYREYIRDKPYIAVSLVPEGSLDLALDESEQVSLYEDLSVSDPDLTIVERGEIARTPSRIDRSIEPPFGATPRARIPSVWRRTLPNGMTVLGIEEPTLPLAIFHLRLAGGQLLENPARAGVAKMLAELMMESTSARSGDAIARTLRTLGAELSISAEQEGLIIRGSTLPRTWDDTMALLEEILLEPKFDSTTVERLRQRTLAQISSVSSSPIGMANAVFAQLLYGDHPLAGSTLGTEETLNEIELEDLREYYARAVIPSNAAFHVIGAITESAVIASLAGLEKRWADVPRELSLPTDIQSSQPGIYFVDVPGASQSVIRIGRIALERTNEEFLPATVMQRQFGGPSGILNHVLRMEKGYTYAITSGFSGTEIPGPFAISTSVRTDATLEALQLIQELLEQYNTSIDDATLETTRESIARSRPAALWAPGLKMGLLRQMSAYGFEADAFLQEERVARAMTIEQARDLARRHFDPSSMIWLIVGDASTQLEGLGALGLGDPIMIEIGSSTQ